MSNYVDGFVIPIKKSKLEEYKVMAEKAGEVWKEHGALDFRETILEDTSTPPDVLSFPKLVGVGDDETVAFSWIMYESREHRDDVNAKVMADPRMDEMMKSDEEPPFDCKRMAYGGFATLVHA